MTISTYMGQLGSEVEIPEETPPPAVQDEMGRVQRVVRERHDMHHCPPAAAPVAARRSDWPGALISTSLDRPGVEGDRGDVHRADRIAGRGVPPEPMARPQACRSRRPCRPRSRWSAPPRMLFTRSVPPETVVVPVEAPTVAGRGSSIPHRSRRSEKILRRRCRLRHCG